MDEWIDAWNAHDIERILAHWADDCVFASPRIAAVMGDPSGTVRGKDALRAYWWKALASAPQLRFELEEVYVGVDCLVIGYRNHRGQRCAEWLRLDREGQAVEGRASYAG
ncbi:nuclear transport factor 2 family protein [Sandaracinus amylolyticus]|uniref:nuclear transport factor 2 family protein n=1 Tax=Sandaracinus amylolyticus TaxID=927083 RepID=UPI001F3382FE|nr:nuclear transport factor 2 family protein [Sandaracinus amylolyticus]